MASSSSSSSSSLQRCLLSRPALALWNTTQRLSLRFLFTIWDFFLSLCSPGCELLQRVCEEAVGRLYGNTYSAVCASRICLHLRSRICLIHQLYGMRWLSSELRGEAHLYPSLKKCFTLVHIVHSSSEPGSKPDTMRYVRWDTLNSSVFLEAPRQTLPFKGKESCSSRRILYATSLTYLHFWKLCALTSTSGITHTRHIQRRPRHSASPRHASRGLLLLKKQHL